MDNDPLESLFGLEDRFYNDGFRLGVKDGKRAGRIEGQIFGIEKGFEKFVVAGRLHGRCAIWRGRMGNIEREEENKTERKEEQQQPLNLQTPSLPDNPRLAKHIQALQALVDPKSMSYENNEDAISDYEDRLKRAKAKMKVIEKIVGEASWDEQSEGQKRTDAEGDSKNGEKKLDGTEFSEGNIEDIKNLNVRR